MIPVTTHKGAVAWSLAKLAYDEESYPTVRGTNPGRLHVTMKAI
jgi:hypothetical protein